MFGIYEENERTLTAIYETEKGSIELWIVSETGTPIERILTISNKGVLYLHQVVHKSITKAVDNTILLGCESDLEG